MSEQRQDPEKLLKRIEAEERQEKRGKLKIYLGASPGVGKTYSMLQDAIAQKAKGLDVIIGVVESHGRHDIEQLIEKLDILPRQLVAYHGKTLPEFDLDAALKRHPGLILMDEMAHTNIPGLRHVKRWLDIRELLDRGIDVWTTLNVQHIESLNDTVTQIIHAPIKETVPDSVLDMADTIELIDLPPDDLLKRLEDGKVYIPEQAELAAESFFRKGNLIALRELALRATAQRVGAEVLLYRQGEGINHIWPTKQKILVCVGPGAKSLRLIRAACRMAQNLNAEWMAVYVDTPRLQSSYAKRNQAMQNLSLAELLGAETRILTGFNITAEVMRFARDKNITLIMIWKDLRSRWRDLLFTSLADDIVRHSDEIDVYIVTGELDQQMKEERHVEHRAMSWKGYLFSFSVVSVITAIAIMLDPFVRSNNLVMGYLLGVTVVAMWGRMGPALFASLLSVLAYDFLFVPPFYSFWVLDAEYFISLVIMFFVSYVLSYLTIMAQQQTESARFVADQTAALHTLSKRLASTRGINNLLTASVAYLAEVFHCDVLILLPEHASLTVRASNKPNETLSFKEQSVAQWVYELGQKAGLGTDTLPSSLGLYLPLLASQMTVGVLCLRPISGQAFSADQVRLLEASAYQVALAVEVERLQGLS